ncbi:MAG: efflux RND transporter periplasmic adaptor subunit [Ruminococcus sp.]|jgi:hypothetical protein|nr:efflux RND transporter periplasmic adaptor subunit [Ruminococcus sp.]
MKKAALPICIAAVLTAIILAVPHFVTKSIPTATPVTVAKIIFTDSVECDGVLIKNEETGVFAIQTYISEKDISKVSTGLKSEVRGDAFPEKVYSATVTDIAGAATQISAGNSTKTVVEVWLEVNDADEALKSGYTAKVKIIVGALQQKRLLPYNSVMQDDGGEYVYVLKNSTAVKRYIITGDELPDGIEVVSGLDMIEEVVKVDVPIEDEAVVTVQE